MGCDIVWARQKIAQITKQQASGFQDVKETIRRHKLDQLHKIGRDGVRFLDEIMPRETLRGWEYVINDAGLKLVWQHIRRNTPVTQDGQTKFDKKRGREVVVQDVINMLDVGTPGHGPIESSTMEYVGKYEWEGTGNVFSTARNKLVWRAVFVSGIEPHNFFKRLKAYILNRGEYRIEFNKILSAEFEALITGKRRRGYIK